MQINPDRMMLQHPVIELKAKRMEHYLLDEGDPDEAMIRRWAFDPEAELMQQDEDLVLHDWTFAETLLELAANPNCPKAEYILNIWDDFTRHHTVHQERSDLDAVRHALSFAQRYSSHRGIQRWIADQETRLRYVDGVGAVDRATSLSMANALLNGIGRSCKIDILRETDTHFLMELSVPHGSHKEWLLIDKLTGMFRYSRWWPNGTVEPEWFDPDR